MQAPTVRTSRGALRGSTTPHGAAFLGVPYAQPPTGDRRYRSPEPVAAWDGVREADVLAPPAPQPTRGLPGIESEPFMGPGWDGSEPQLALNVWTPDPGAGGLPVMVFIHGGAFVAGAASAPVYDGAHFARDGVVLVSITYRLGAEGFLVLDGGETNVALRDQLAALRWVREEIAAFGGDPDNVTVFGQSAGAIGLALLLSTAAPQGLLRRAIVQSGGLRLAFSPEQSRRVGAALAADLGVPATADGFRSVDIGRVMQAQAALVPGSIDLRTDEDTDPAGGLAPMLPVRDGDVVATDPFAAVAGGSAAGIELLVGDTTEEGNLYLAGLPNYDDFPEEAAHALAAAHHPDPGALLAAYRAELPGASTGRLAAQVLTDAVFRVPTARLAEAQAGAGGPIHVYEFAWPSGALGGRLGACHAVELPFVFDTLDAPGMRGPRSLLGPEPAPAELARRTHAAWVAFARDGDPGWAPYDTERRRVMRFDDPESGEVDDPRPEARRVWADAGRR